ncbi:methyl-accepting chemotaxis protein [Ancylobacter radicis]|uniref:HAMP domain-containing protein n=1 Tax=Ancylobacter radicis TaxID=2836179 RepID=A0ABS5RBD5_9HYPH|nr:HAMP domain-containing methyl-accepting chemotaxis protein [Ancylobacter radicis]MBS9477657.1 HAMP domain-containing protein [Ancylobacter radicis]
MSLKNLPILGKILLIVAVMGLAAIIVAGVGWRTISGLSATMSTVATSERASREAMDLRIDIIAISRMTYQVALDPGLVAGLTGESQSRQKEMLARLPVLEAAADDTEIALIGEVRTALKDYFTSIDTLLAVAQAGTADPIKASLDSCLAAQKIVTTKVKAYTTYSATRAGQLREEAAATAGAAAMIQAGAAGAAIVIGVLLSLAVANGGVVRPVRRLTDAMGRIAAGDLDAVLPDGQRKDEIGRMIHAVAVFRQGLVERNAFETEAATREADAAAERKRIMHDIAASFEAKVGQFVDAQSSAAVQLESTANRMSGTAARTSDETRILAGSATQTASSVETVASATEELAASASEIGARIGQASDLASAAVNQVTAADAEVQRLAEDAQRIGDIVKLISDIASQTNLLALNATIEAARAGEAGKGFAVVATEVKQLASQTASATGEISTQIAQLQGVAGSVVDKIQTIGDAIKRMHEAAAAVAAAAEEQQAATQEIARNVRDAAQETEQVSTRIETVDRNAAETGSGAAQVLTAVQGLSRTASALQVEVRSFVENVRAA